MSLQTDILEQLEKVARERQRRDDDLALQQSVLRVKDFQARRFRHTYSDLARDPRYARATGFFLDDLYGPQDFSARDAQFARIVPAITRLFPGRIVETVYDLARLHALSEELDTLMGAALQDESLDALSYVQAWRAVGRRTSREEQVSLTAQVGHALDQLTRVPMLRTTLRMMRKPASAAGLSSLQGFLEAGFDTFRDMRGADVFLRTIAQRERDFLARLFDAEDVTHETVSGLFP